MDSLTDNIDSSYNIIISIPIYIFTSEEAKTKNRRASRNFTKIKYVKLFKLFAW